MGVYLTAAMQLFARPQTNTVKPAHHAGFTVFNPSALFPQFPLVSQKSQRVTFDNFLLSIAESFSIVLMVGFCIPPADDSRSWRDQLRRLHFARGVCG